MDGYDGAMNSSTSADQGRAYVQAVEALNRQQWPTAYRLATTILPGAAGHAGVHFVAGVSALQMQQVAVAIGLLRRAVELNSSRADYRAQLARALAAGGLLREAVEAAHAARELGPDDPMTLDTLGVVYSQANAHADAAAMFRRASALRPDVASFRFNLATSLTFAGELEAAEVEYEACLQRDPHYWKAHLALAQLRRQTRDRNHLERLQRLASVRVGDPAGEMYVHLALSKELEDLGETDLSFEHLSRGKASGRRLRQYAFARDDAIFQALEEAFPEPAGAAAGDPTEEPVFIIGMPRSGTTLVDRILSSHPDVHSAGELQNFGVLLKRASGSRTPNLLDVDTIERSRRLDWTRLGRSYVESTRPGTGHARFFTDKLPHNFLYAGHIAMALPRARIICLRRDPMDTCLSNFRQLFAQGSPYYDYSFDLLDTGRYFLGFDRLMAHWRRVLPGRILEVTYEDLVQSQEATTRLLLDFCGLAWNDACLRFERNEAPVATASAVQVRSPMYRNAMQRWRRYEPQLAQLRQLLESGGIAIESA